jgi:hypothetical protein
MQPGSGIGVEPVEAQSLALHGILDTCFFQVIEDHGSEVLLIAGFLLGYRAVHIAVGGGEDAMG